MKKVLGVVFAAIFILVMVGCAPQQVTQEKEKKLKVVTSFYPLSEIVAQVARGHVVLKNLVSAGLEPHDYELTPQDIVSLNQADLVIYNGMGLEPWSDKIIPMLQKNGVKTFNISEIVGRGIQLADPHYWLSIQLYLAEVVAVEHQLITIDPEWRTIYEENANIFMGKLIQLDREYKTGLENCKLDTFVTSHDAFNFLAAEYQLKSLSIAGLSPEAEPSPKKLIEIIEKIKKKKIHYVMVENMENVKIAEVLAKEAGIKTLILSPLESLTSEEAANGENYISVMRKNLKNLRTALECN